MGRKKQKKQDKGKAVQTASPALPPFDDWCDEWYSVNVLVTLEDGREVYGFYNYDSRQWHVTPNGKTIEIVQPDEVKSWREWGKEETSTDD